MSIFRCQYGVSVVCYCLVSVGLPWTGRRLFCRWLLCFNTTPRRPCALPCAPPANLQRLRSVDGDVSRGPQRQKSHVTLRYAMLYHVMSCYVMSCYTTSCSTLSALYMYTVTVRYVYIYIYLYTYIHTYIHTHTVCLCVNICVYVIYIYIYIYTHTYIYTHIHTHVNIHD